MHVAFATLGVALRVVSAVGTADANVAVVRHLRDGGYVDSIAVALHTEAETEQLDAAGAE